VAALRSAGARPLVISPDLDAALQRRLEDDQIDAIQREYRPGDLDGIGLVIAATDNPATNEAVWQDAQATGCLVNVVDDPDRCNFHVPAIVRRGDLTLSVSTGGNSPALARRIRRSLEQQFDSAYGPYLVLLGELRPLVRQRVASQAQRKMLWETLLDAKILELLRAGATEAARERALEIVESFC
jgi:precorrin-2 dehydrogenase/sirohydrochlorin ferrochelatase